MGLTEKVPQGTEHHLRYGEMPHVVISIGGIGQMKEKLLDTRVITQSGGIGESSNKKNVLL